MSRVIIIYADDKSYLNGDYRIFHLKQTRKWGIIDRYTETVYLQPIFNYIQWCGNYAKLELNGKVSLLHISQIKAMIDSSNYRKQQNLLTINEKCYIDTPKKINRLYDIPQFVDGIRIIYGFDRGKDIELPVMNYYGIDSLYNSDDECVGQVFKFRSLDDKNHIYITIEDLLDTIDMFPDSMVFFEKAAEQDKEKGRYIKREYDFDLFVDQNYALEISEEQTNEPRSTTTEEQLVIVKGTVTRKANEIIHKRVEHSGAVKKGFRYKSQGTLNKMAFAEKEEHNISDSQLFAFFQTYFSKHPSIKITSTCLLKHYHSIKRKQKKYRPEFLCLDTNVKFRDVTLGSLIINSYLTNSHITEEKMKKYREQREAQTKHIEQMKKKFATASDEERYIITESYTIEFRGIDKLSILEIDSFL